jgi:hypothetical protein
MGPCSFNPKVCSIRCIICLTFKRRVVAGMPRGTRGCVAALRIRGVLLSGQGLMPEQRDLYV